nr:MAG TPA: hypothetical protein [Caudoviricetes sp.]
MSKHWSQVSLKSSTAFINLKNFKIHKVSKISLSRPISSKLYKLSIKFTLQNGFFSCINNQLIDSGGAGTIYT